MHYSFKFVLASLAVWRLTHLLSKEDGPWDLLRRFRTSLGQGVWGRLFSCFYCLSVWIALPFAFFVGGSLAEKAVGWLAVSGAAILLERLMREPLEVIMPEDDHELLRRDGGTPPDYQPERH